MGWQDDKVAGSTEGWQGDDPVENSAVPIAVGNSSANPDAAAKAYGLGQKVGMPALAVEQNYDEVFANSRASQASQAALNNSAIAAYITSHPMASKVSADDYDSLQNMSKWVREIEAGKVIFNGQGEAPRSIWDRVRQGVEEGFSGTNIEDSKKQILSWPMPEAVKTAITHSPISPMLPNVSVFDALKAGGYVLEAPMAGINATAGLAGGIAQRLGMNEAEANRLERDIVALSTVGFTAEGVRPHMSVKSQIQLKAVDRAVEAAQQSATRERSPEMFENFVKAHGPDEPYYVDPQAAIKLYESKDIMLGDPKGPLAWIPDLEEQVARAKATGEEITVPSSKYLANVDEATHKALREDLRTGDESVTLREAEEFNAWHGSDADFEAFDLSKNRSGEGANTYGYGVYLAENKNISEGYSRNVPNSKFVKSIRELYDQDFSPDDAWAALKESRSDFTDKQWALLEALEKDDWLGFDYPHQAVNAVLKKAAAERFELSPGTVAARDALTTVYGVSVKANKEAFLDWDKPYNEQTQTVQKMINNVLGEDMSSNLTGEQIYKKLVDKFKDDPDAQKAASEALASIGIKGIRYLDAGSRKDGVGTSNYVVFSDKDIVIKTKNGKVVEGKEVKPEAPNIAGSAKGAPSLDEVSPHDFAAAELPKALAAEEEALGLKPIFTEPPPDVSKSIFERYSRRIAEQQEAIAERAQQVAENYVRRQLTPEWKAEFEQVLNEARIDLANRPDIATDIFLRTGKLPTGEILEGVKLARDAIERLVPELAEGLKKYTAKAGLEPDTVAKVFGFEDGKSMLQALHGLLGQRAETGRGPLAFFDTIAKEEATRRMEGKYGTLPELISDTAREMIADRAKPELLHADLKMIADAAGFEMPFTKAEMLAAAENAFSKMKAVDAAHPRKLERAMLNSWKAVEKALAKGDFIEAFKARQRQSMAMLAWKQSKDLIRTMRGVAKNRDFIAGETAVKSVEPEALEHLRQVLAQMGDESAMRFATGKTAESLEQFVVNSEGQMQVADWLYDRRLPQLEDLTVGEMNDFANSIKSMLHVGRQRKKLFNLHGAAEFDNVKFDIIKELERFTPKETPINPSLAQRANSLWRYVIASHTLVERVMDYTDKFNPRGPLTAYLDRPLRDANTKEIRMTEFITADLRKLAKYTDDTVNDAIPNRVIPRKENASGFADMDRGNLRQLMLYMGSESGIKKVEEGFGVKRDAVMGLIHDNATKNDWHWVQGMWDIYAKLYEEAREVYLRDTGVPPDKVQPVSITTRHGFDVSGGYTPINYDRIASNIEGDLRAKDPLFDNNYRFALPSNGYTKGRTGYSGPLDLTGMYTAGELQTMIHDIAFREAIRNANKLINDGEFTAAMTRYWGPEYSKLFPGWIRQIANVHNYDSTYGNALARGIAAVRQNLVSALIAFNPGTFMKHGGTAAIMSADRVGIKNLAEATKDLGARDIWRSAKDLIRKSDPKDFPADWVQALRDVTAPTDYGGSVREFILNSSAVMRNRQRKYIESIRGAYEGSSESGMLQSTKEFRQDAMTLGRAPVAFSDALSAMPTWYAAYKKAIEKMPHEDAVFVADKEVSRAHGSNFVGDRPAVMHIPNTAAGEITKSFVALYNFWNHQFNNQLQLAWDMQAKATGRAEPGANMKSISRRMALMASIIAIEELAAPPLTDHGGWIASVFKSMLRYFGGGIVGLRELSNAAASGYEPSVGMIGTASNVLSKTSVDAWRAMQGKKVSERWPEHLATTLGLATGVGGAQVGRTGKYLTDVATGKQRPHNVTEFRQGLRTGLQKAPKH